MKPRRWVLVLLGLVGCATSNAIQPNELTRLDGYQGEEAPSGAERQVETLAGGRLTVRSDAYLFLDTPSARVGGRFASISVRDGVFDGRTLEGRQVQVPLDQVTHAEVDQTNQLVTGAIIAGTLLALLAGGLYLSHANQPRPVSGRALRVRGKVVAAPLTAADGWRRPGAGPDLSTLSPEGRRALADAWTHAARAEHASVPAFSRLSLTLMALGAPARLVERAHLAALEEIEHARLSFALASAYAATPVAPGPIVELFGAPAVTARSLAELAEESLLDGCLLEGVAAAAAVASLAGARDPAVREALGIIARDEASHAALAWEVVGWCCGRGGPELRGRLLKLAHRTPVAAPPPEAPSRLSAELAAHGTLPSAVWRELLARTRTEVASRLALMLAEGPGARAVQST